MRRYLLDTNACIRVLNATSAPVVERFRSAAPSRLRLCSIVKAELLYGAHRSRNPNATLFALERFFEPLRSVPFDDGCATQYGRIRADLARGGAVIGANDLAIAATALAFDLTVVTHNTREFGRVVGLRVEDWEAA